MKNSLDIKKRILKRDFIISFGVFVILLFPFACVELYSYSEEDLFGTWNGNRGKINIDLKFGQDATCELSYNTNDTKIKKIKGTFEADFTKTPIPLSIRNIPNITHPLHTIIKFKGPNTLIMGEFGPRLKLRPITFKSDRIIVFTRSSNS